MFYDTENGKAQRSLKVYLCKFKADLPKACSGEMLSPETPNRQF